MGRLLRVQQTAGNRAALAILARTPDDDDDPGFSRDPNEAQKIGSAGEREEIGRVRRELAKNGFGTVYDRHDIALMKRNIDAGRPNRPPRIDEWLVETFPDGRARPELVGIDHKRKRILVLDLTAGPGSSAAHKPGDANKLPADAAAGAGGKPHLEKTKAYGEQVVRKLPPSYSGYKVTARDRYWKTGKYSVEITIRTPQPQPAGQPRTPPTPPKQTKPKGGGWDPTAGPPQAGKKGPDYSPAPMDKPPKAPPAAAGVKRKIVLDGPVFDQIHRGNKQMADKLKVLVKTHDVYIANSAFKEAVTNRDIPRMGKATELILQDLGIKVTPPASAADVAEITRRNTLRNSKTVLSSTDAMVAADAKSISGEVWSGDRGFRNNAGSVRKTLGVPVAPESERIKLVERVGGKLPEQDYRTGRKLLGLKEVEISLTGKVEPAKPATPPAKPATPPAKPDKPGGWDATSAPDPVRKGPNFKPAKDPAAPPNPKVASGGTGGKVPTPAGGAGAPPAAGAAEDIFAKVERTTGARVLRRGRVANVRGMSLALIKVGSVYFLIDSLKSQGVLVTMKGLAVSEALTLGVRRLGFGFGMANLAVLLVGLPSDQGEWAEREQKRLRLAFALIDDAFPGLDEKDPPLYGQIHSELVMLCDEPFVFEDEQATARRRRSEYVEQDNQAAEKALEQQRATALKELDELAERTRGKAPLGASDRFGIRASVGASAANRPEDVRLVSERLRALGYLTSAKGDLAAVIDAIETYQLHVLKSPHADGRVDPGGKTMKALIAGRRATGMSLP